MLASTEYSWIFKFPKIDENLDEIEKWRNANVQILNFLHLLELAMGGNTYVVPQAQPANFEMI